MTTDITELAQREKFEAWAEECNALPWGYLKKRRTNDGFYSEHVYTSLWAAWKAANAELVEALEKAQQLATQQGNIACALFDEVTAQRQRIAELEESHAQVIQSRDHYQRMSEEGLKQLAESCAVSAESFTCPRCGRTTTHPEGWHYCHKREAE
ncbi:hypothetical protein ACU60F_16320 [Klebsiella aerogenes]